MKRLLNFSFTDMRPLTLGVLAAIVTTVAVVAAFAVGTLRIFDDTYSMTAVLEETGDLRSGDVVRMAGIEIGRVTNVVPDFDTGVVVVRFEIDQGIEVGHDATAEVSLATLLGGRYLRIDGPVEAPFMEDLPDDERRIPIERTRLPIGVQDALGQLTGTIEQIDADGIDDLLRASAEIAGDNADQFDPLLTDVVTLTDTLNSRRDQIDALLGATTELTETLADKDDTIEALIQSSASLLAQLSDRRDDLATLLGSGSDAVQTLDGLVTRNRSELEQILAAADVTTDVLRQRLPELNQSLALLGPTLAQAGTSGDSGPWIDSLVYGIGVVQFASIIDDLGVSP